MLSEKISAGNLSRKFFINKASEIAETISLSKRSLINVNDLLQRFENVNTFDSSKSESTFSMLEFLNEVKNSIQPRLGKHQLFIQSDDLKYLGSKEILWQIFFNLIENSIIHGFKDMDIGMIHINISEANDDVIINYQDDGCGILEKKSAKIFEPFFTSNRSQKSLGLGLNIISNLISHNLAGRIKLIDSPVGARFEINFPKQNKGK